MNELNKMPDLAIVEVGKHEYNISFGSGWDVSRSDDIYVDVHHKDGANIRLETDDTGIWMMHDVIGVGTDMLENIYVESWAEEDTTTAIVLVADCGETKKKVIVVVHDIDWS